jgi:16S rRNA processing protein RimM
LNKFYYLAEIKSILNKSGFVSAKSFSDILKRLTDIHFVFIEIFGDKRKLIVESSDIRKEELILKFKNFDSDTDVFDLVGKKVFIEVEKDFELNKNEYLIKDLLDCKVVFENKFFGKLIDVIQLESNDVYVLLSEDNSEVMLPAVKDFIESIDIKSKTIFLKKSPSEIF